MSRIDMILISPALIPDILEVGFGARILSDHSPYWVTLRLPSAPHMETEPILAHSSPRSGGHTMRMDPLFSHQCGLGVGRARVGDI